MLRFLLTNYCRNIAAAHKLFFFHQTLFIAPVANSLNEERYIDYFALKKKIDPMELKLFLNAVLSKCYIRQGRVASIVFQNGYKHRFIHNDEEAQENS